MNTLDDLRHTLDVHADDVHDDAVSARSAAVRGRAATVRRRRAAGVGVAAALVLVGGLLVPGLVGDREPGPADRTFLGKVAPATLQSLGHTYRFAEGVQATDGDASIRLRPSDTPRLVTWASTSADVTVATTVEGARTGSARTDFDDFTYVAPRESGRWTISAGDQGTAVAVYELDEDVVADGTTVGDGVTFRQEVGSEQLVTAAALEEGAAVLTLTATVPESGRMRVAEWCQGVPSDRRSDLWVVVSVDGDGGSGRGGCDDDLFDPAVGDATWLDERHLPDPGEQVEVRMWVSRGIDGDPIDLDGARLAMGLYDVAEPEAVVGGASMARLVEHDGHQWSFVEAREAGPGEDRVVLRNDGDSPLLAVGAYAHAGGVVTMRGGRGDVFRSSGALGSSGTIGVVVPGDTARVSARRSLGPRGSMGIAFYERLD